VAETSSSRVFARVDAFQKRLTHKKKRVCGGWVAGAEMKMKRMRGED
jgi:hypothetical protein